jgi:glycolate oxidase FAD binding subunit
MALTPPPADALRGRLVEPETAPELAATLADASRAGLRTVIEGGGTKSWGRPAPAADLTIRTTRMNQLIVHRHGDLTATVQAGMRLADLNASLSAYRQWLPVESAFDNATIGGVVATNDCGPLRHRSGTPRDLLIGVTLALTDGRVVKSGGHVVKNVAGYDLGRLISGSFGTLATIVDATFKLVPMPQVAATLVVDYDDEARLAGDVAALMASQLEPAAVDIRAGRLQAAHRLLVRFASSPASTTEQVNHATALLTGRVEVVSGAPEPALWRDQVRAPWSSPAATVVRMSWLPSTLADVLALVRGYLFTGRAIGAGLVRLDDDPSTHAATIERWRASGIARNVVVLQAPPAVKEQVDVWGPPPSAASVMGALKQMFDPAGILNAGRGPI